MEAFDRMALIAEARQWKIESEEKNFAIARAALAAALKRIAEIEAEGPREEFLVYMKQMVQSLDSEAWTFPLSFCINRRFVLSEPVFSNKLMYSQWPESIC